jgi:hypothetical protein
MPPAGDHGRGSPAGAYGVGINYPDPSFWHAFCYTHSARMRLDMEVWLRGNDFATSDSVDLPIPEPAGWSDHHVRRVLEELLRAIDRAKHPDADRDRHVTLRGFNWIVNPFEGGVLVSVEIQLGAAAAGPFSIDQQQLEGMIDRAIAGVSRSDTSSIH